MDNDSTKRSIGTPPNWRDDPKVWKDRFARKDLRRKRGESTFANCAIADRLDQQCKQVGSCHRFHDTH